MNRLKNFFLYALMLAAALCAAGSEPPVQASARAVWTEFEDFARVSHPQPHVVYHRTVGSFQASARAMIPDNASWAAGFYGRGRVHVRVLTTAEDNRRLLRHELAHALLRGRDIPRWFQEGFARYMEDRRVDPGAPVGQAFEFGLTGLDLPGATRIPPDGWQAFYQGSELAVQYLVATRGEERLRDLAGSLARGRAFEEAFAEAFGVSVAGLQSELRRVARGG